MLRVHDSFSVVSTMSQLLPLQVGVKTLRLRVPVVSQVPEKPPHDDQDP